MSQPIEPAGGKLGFLAGLTRPTGRRAFLKYSGMTVAVVGLAGGMGACSGDDEDNPFGTDPGATVNLGSGDTGVLNYAYALEQLEAAFYTQVVATPYAGITAAEQQILTDVRDHEVAHREFLKAALGTNRIRDLTPDFSAVSFGSRDSVLTTARTFEDLGVSAYNGAGRLLTSPDLLLVAGKIVSVEARHASALRDLIAPKTAAFAGDDVVDANGLDVQRAPAAVLAAADPFVKNPINAGSLPTT
jgi:hypothetical protein